MNDIKRVMPNHLSRLETAYRHHESLRLSGEQSVPAEVGKLAILFSCYEAPNREGQFEAFYQEAVTLWIAARSSGVEAEIIGCENMDPVYDTIRAREVSSIVTVGNGSFSEFWVPRRTSLRAKKLGWSEVARQTTHLKTGGFQHRVCGNFNETVSLPFATFLMLDQSQIYGALGRSVKDVDPPEDSFQPIFQASHIPLDQLRLMSTQRFRNHPKITRKGLFIST